MLIYSKSVKEFKEDIILNKIEDEISSGFNNIGWKAPKKEIDSWRNSLPQIKNAIDLSAIPDDTMISIEFIVPYNTRGRIDVIIFGKNGDKENVGIIELKQWQEVAETQYVEPYVGTYLGGGLRRVLHPSYQANSYRSTLINFNENVRVSGYEVHAAAFLHNMTQEEKEKLMNEKYKEGFDVAPVWSRKDVNEVATWMRNLFADGNGKTIHDEVTKSEYSPSSSVTLMIDELLKGNPNFALTHEQYEVVGHVMTEMDKYDVNMIEGKPGTGKTFVALELLRRFLKQDKNVVFATPNANLRHTIIDSLHSAENDFNSKEALKNIIVGTGSFSNYNEVMYDIVIVDEAQAINETMNGFSAKELFKKIIKSSKKVILLYDSAQQIRYKELGGTDSINMALEEIEIKKERIFHQKLLTQMRAKASQDLVELIEYMFDKRENSKLPEKFKFKYHENPNEMWEEVLEKNKHNESSRVMATYSWPWKGKNDQLNSLSSDVVIDEFDFAKPWNSAQLKSWAIDPRGANQVGSIHTTRGQEFDHVGVIIGEHFVLDDNNNIVIDWEKWEGRAKYGTKEDKDRQFEIAYNAVYTLMTRSRKSLHVFVVNPKLREYIKNKLNTLD